jgi:aspartyl-tRNA(Asn)/glutamyl-tRNA(Gln) amidotransferase subunit C
MLKDELKTTASLAMLEFEHEAQIESAVKEMLDYFSKMIEIDVNTLEPTTHALVKDNRVRRDEVARSGDPEELLEKAPSREDRFFKIPNVL